MTSKPTAVRWIIALGWARIAISVLILLLAFVFISSLPARSAFLAGLRNGYVERAGYAPGEFGPVQLGQMLADATLAATPAALMLLFVARRKLMGLRIAAGIWALFSLPNPIAWPLSVTTVLAFRPSTKAYCQQASSTAPPVA